MTIYFDNERKMFYFQIVMSNQPQNSELETMDCTQVKEVLKRVSKNTVDQLTRHMVHQTKGEKQFRSQLVGFLCENPHMVRNANSNLAPYMQVDLEN